MLGRCAPVTGAVEFVYLSHAFGICSSIQNLGLLDSELVTPTSDEKDMAWEKPLLTHSMDTSLFGNRLLHPVYNRS